MRALTFADGLCYDPHHPQPPVGQGDTLVRVSQAGICSTDLEICAGYMGFRGILGHEFVGVIEQCPARKRVGLRVVGEINCVCGRCDLCLQGLSNHCRNRSVLGIVNHDGCFADYLRLPLANLHDVPETVDDDAAVFVEPLAAAFQVVKQLGRSLNEKTWVTVLGTGRLGLLVAQVLRNTGAKVRAVGRNPRTVELCERWGVRARHLADITPRHDQDVVVDCTGSVKGLETALAMCRPRGTLVLKSTVAGREPLNLSPAVVDEITVLGSRCGPFRPAIEALARRDVDVFPLIDRRARLEEGVAAMERAGQSGVLKVILTM